MNHQPARTAPNMKRSSNIASSSTQTSTLLLWLETARTPGPGLEEIVYCAETTIVGVWVKKEQKKKAGPTGRKRRKMESDKMDGKVSLGAKTLQQLCLEKASAYAEDVDDLGDLPERQMRRLSEIFTKKRVMKTKTFPLFLQPENEQMIVHDCACEYAILH